MLFTLRFTSSSVLTFMWEGLTNEGGSMSDARQEAQPRMWSQHQTWTGANLQHNTLQPTSLRLVCVCWLHMTFVCDLVCLPANLIISRPLCRQMKTAGTDVITVWWWCRPDCVSTPTTRRPAVPPAPRVLSEPKGIDQPITGSPCRQKVKRTEMDSPE